MSSTGLRTNGQFLTCKTGIPRSFYLFIRHARVVFCYLFILDFVYFTSVNYIITKVVYMYGKLYITVLESCRLDIYGDFICIFWMFQFV